MLCSLGLFLGVVAIATTADVTMAVTQRTVERRVVLIIASNSAEANQRAQAQNPGWTALTSKMVGPNMWEVTITK
jgi:hypothetical protein